MNTPPNSPTYTDPDSPSYWNSAGFDEYELNSHADHTETHDSEENEEGNEILLSPINTAYSLNIETDPETNTETNPETNINQKQTRRRLLCAVSTHALNSPIFSPNNYETKEIDTEYENDSLSLLSAESFTESSLPDLNTPSPIRSNVCSNLRSSVHGSQNSMTNLEASFIDLALSSTPPTGIMTQTSSHSSLSEESSSGTPHIVPPSPPPMPPKYTDPCVIYSLNLHKSKDPLAELLKQAQSHSQTILCVQEPNVYQHKITGSYGYKTFIHDPSSSRAAILY